MPRKKVEYLIPFIKVQDPKWGQPIGSVPYQISRYEMRNPKWMDRYEWKANAPFDACLKFVRFGHGAKALVKNSETDAEYYISQSTLAEVLCTKTLIYGAFVGRWKFKKHGNCFSITLVTP